MRHIAHIENGKIVNISVWENKPDGEAFLDVTDLQPTAKIGDEVVKKKVVSQDAVKELDHAQKLCSIAVKAVYDNVLDAVLHNFRISMMTELWVLNAVAASESIAVVDDTGTLRELSTKEMTALINDMFKIKQEAARTLAAQQATINKATSVAELSRAFPEYLPLVHPQVQ